jgi:hypothetical protein
MRTNTSAQIHQLFELKKRGQLEARVAIRRKQKILNMEETNSEEKKEFKHTHK